MDLGSSALGPPARAETPDVGLTRRAARLSRIRKATQGGEGIEQSRDACSAARDPGMDGKEQPVIIDQDSAQMKTTQPQIVKYLLMESGSMKEELRAVKEELDGVKTLNKMLDAERGNARREVEKLRMELENISTSSSFEGSDADLKKKIKKLEKSLERANSEIAKGETAIMILEGEKEGLTDELEKMRREKKTSKSSRLREEEPRCQSRLEGARMTVVEKQIKILTEERDKAMREVENLKFELENTPCTSFQGSVADLKREIRILEKKIKTAGDEVINAESSILVLEGEKEELMDQIDKMKKRKKKPLSSKNRDNDEELEQLQELLSVVQSTMGLPENMSPVDSAAKLREKWHSQETRFHQLRDGLEEITERKRTACTNTQLLREAVEKILEVEPGSMEIVDLVDKIQDIGQFYALKIDNMHARLEAKQQATATDMDIKFKKKTKIPEFLALFGSVWNKQQDLVTSLDKKLLESDCRIEELEAALDQMKEELEQTTTPKEIKKKKKRLLRTIINTMIPEQTVDEKDDKLKTQADQIRRLEAIQESKYRQDHEVLALHRESTAIRQTNDELQEKQRELEEVIEDLNHSLDEEKQTVQELRQLIQIYEGRGLGAVLRHERIQHIQGDEQMKTANDRKPDTKL
ncbi:cingulin-like [Lytechinus variegatus]|uniref:cingulin-like n=1 Tax=Lytechinus variegatus TaxID=7654 RepID=UPI001BB1479A|nr:cingulin-like [Lytechinus variegatus]